MLKALKDEARETVKSMLIHPGYVSAVMEQLRFRVGRPEQHIRSQLNSVREVPPISEQHLARIVPFATHKFNFSIRPHKHGRKGKSRHGIFAVFGEFQKG